jgi:hypothetical protein
MSIVEKHMSLGSWSLNLKANTPQNILDLFGDSGFLGHIIITPQRVDPRLDVLSLSRYTGVFREREFQEDSKTISGSGLAFWLADEEGKGAIYETVKSYSAQSFVATLTDLLPASLAVGNIVAEVGTFSGSFQWVTPREAIEHVLSIFGAEYRITPQGAFDAGQTAQLFVTNPTTLVQRKQTGDDPLFRPLPLADASLGGDFTGYTTKVIVLTQGEFRLIQIGEQELSPPTSIRDLRGNLVQMVRRESSTDALNAAAHATAVLNENGRAKLVSTLSTDNYDIDGTLKVGDYLWVYDPESGLIDTANEVRFRGQVLHPAKLRTLGFSYPVTSQMGVYFRDNTAAGNITDISDWVIPETGATRVEVGAFARSLVPEAGEPMKPPLGALVNTDKTPPSIPNAPTVAGNPLYIQVTSNLGTGGGSYNLEDDLHHLSVYVSTTSGFTPGPTTYVGDIPATWAHLSAGVSVVRTFEVPSDTPRFVRITAVDTVGNVSPASAEVGVTALLINTQHITNLAVTDAKIGSASVAKLTSGEMTTALFTVASGGLIRAGRANSPFNYWYADEVGIRAYRNGSARFVGGTAALEYSLATGNLTLNGGALSGGSVTGAVIRTAASGKRAELYITGNFGLVPSLEFHTGDAAEVAAPAIFGAIGIITDSRLGSLQMRSAQLGTGFVELQLWSKSHDSLFPAYAWLNGGPLRFGTASSGIKFDGTGPNLNLNFQSIFFRGENDANHRAVYDGGYDGPVFSGFNTVRLLSNNHNVQIRVGLGGAIADLVDNGATVFRGFYADVFDQSDPRLKDKVGDAPSILAEIRATPKPYRYKWKHEGPDSQELLGVSSTDLPSYLTRDSYLNDEQGNPTKKVTSIKVGAMGAWLMGGLQELDARVDEIEARLEELAA